MKVNDAFAAILKQRGVRRAYGIPGTETLALIDALGKAGIPYLLTQHETTAGNMASVEGHLTGVPGVCLVTQGPGATNMLTAVANAQLDRFPLLAVATTVSAEPGAAITHQRVPLVSLFQPVAKASMELTAENAARVIPEALDLACSPRPGPVFLALSGHEGRKEVEDPPEALRGPQAGPHTGGDGSRYSPTASVVPSEEQLQQVAARVREASRPALVAGIGLLEARAAEPFRQLAEKLRCPFALSMRAKGQVSEEHPLFVGTYGARPAGAIHSLLDGADLVVLVGLDGVEFSRPRAFQAPLVSLAMVGANDPVFPAEVAADGDLGYNLRWLASRVDPQEGWDSEEWEGCRRKTRQALEPKGRGGLAPQTVFRLLREEMPREALVTPDVGAHKQPFCQSWTCYEPGTFLTGTGYSPMGVGLGTAMAAKLVHPERPVALVTGDGGLLMYVGELLTLSRLGLPITVVVLVDGALTGIKSKQVERGLANAGVDFGEADFVSIARGCGLEAARAVDAESCRAAVRAGLKSGGPFLIQADINPQEYR